MNKRNKHESPDKPEKYRAPYHMNSLKTSCSTIKVDPDVSIRNLHHLYTPRDTLECALSSCRPCAYKIACFDVAQDKHFTRIAPNQRPEQCHRSNKSNFKSYTKTQRKLFDSNGYLGYYKGMNILTVGDGDFSFSLAIARIMSTKKNQNENRNGFLFVSSYESHNTLKSIYPNINETIKELQDLGAHVLFELDATRIHEHNDFNRIRGNELFFHRIIWNFPCTAEPNGQDGQNEEMEQNKTMLKQFMLCAESLLDSKMGEIHMAHKTKPPYDQWGMQDIATMTFSSNTNSDALSKNYDPPILFLGRIVFDRCCFQPYTPRKALDKKSFTCHDACFFVFGKTQREINPLSTDAYSDEHERSIRTAMVTYPPTIPLKVPLKTDDIVPVTKNMILKIRSVNLSDALSRLKSKKLKKKRKADKVELNTTTGLKNKNGKRKAGKIR